jgi:hypothetical protein
MHGRIKRASIVGSSEKCHCCHEFPQNNVQTLHLVMRNLSCCTAPQTELPNPKTGLEPRDVARVKRSWRHLRPRVVDVLQAALGRMSAESVALMVTPSAGVARDELRWLAVKMAFRLEGLVDVLDDADDFVVVCSDLGETYKRFEAVRAELINAFFEQVEKALGRRNFGSKTRTSWLAVLRIVEDFSQPSREQ